MENSIGNNEGMTSDSNREQQKQIYRKFIKGYSMDKHILSWLEENYEVAGVDELVKLIMNELKQCFIDFAMERNEYLIDDDLISDSPE